MSDILYIRWQNRDYGPMSREELAPIVRDGCVPLTAWVHGGAGQWRLLADDHELRVGHPDLSEPPQGEPRPEASWHELLGKQVQSDAADKAVDNAAPARRRKSQAALSTDSVSADPIWFLIREKKKFGPYTVAEVIAQLQKKQITSGAFVWRPGFTTWRKLSTVTEFSREALSRLAQGDGVDVMVKRRFKRAPYEVEVIAHDNNRAFAGKTMVIGEGGLYLSAERPAHSVGARLKLHFREGKTAPFNAIAEVVSVVKGDDSGYCLKFVAISDADRRRIAKLVSERRT